MMVQQTKASRSLNHSAIKSVGKPGRIKAAMWHVIAGWNLPKQNGFNIWMQMIIYCPTRSRGQMEFLGECPQADIVYGPATWEYWNDQKPHCVKNEIAKPHDPWILLARWTLPQTGAPLWRKQAILNVGGWKSDQPCCQEHELYLRLLMAGKRFAYCPKNGAVYRHWGEGTVFNRNKDEFCRQRFKLHCRQKEYLRQSNQLTPLQASEIHQAQFEIARKAWLYDRVAACEMERWLRKQDPRFVPVNISVPPLYRLVYGLLGFRNAEIMAEFKRTVKRLAGKLVNQL